MTPPLPATALLRAVFRYCPRCGVPEPNIIGDRQLQCPACGLRFFFNTAAAAGAFIFHHEKLLLCVRAHEPGKGLLDVPGGFIEFDETIEDGLRREIAEELHIEVGDFHYLMSAPNDYPYAGVPYKTADVFFVCEAHSLDHLRPADDVAEIRLTEPHTVDAGQFAFASARRAFTALLATLGPAAS
jgi:ADP-ribose pyrophosphatase YjhB (NUDIX family)